MLTDKWTLVGLILSCIISLILFIFIAVKKNKKQIQKAFMVLIGEAFMWCAILIGQITLSHMLGIDPLMFENWVCIFSFTLPVIMLMVGLIFANTKMKITYKYLMLFIVPIISMIVLWTNNNHHLFYKFYSTSMSHTIIGQYFYIYSLYSYLLMIIGFGYLISYSIKNSGFFSKQSIMIALGTSIPIIANILGTFKLIPLSIYITPISFTLAMVFYALAILKFQFLNISPIALQRINDNMSDGYIVLNEDMKVIDFNKTLLKMLNLHDESLRNKDWIDFQNVLLNLSEEDMSSLFNIIEKSKKSTDMTIIEKQMDKIDKYFNIEINSILAKSGYVGTLVLFKDITQHKKDQELILRKTEYDTLGKVARNIGHDLNSPEMAMSSYIYDIKGTISGMPVADIDSLSENTRDDLIHCIDCLENCMKKISQITNKLRVNSGKDINNNDEMFDLKKQIFTIEQLFGDKLRDNHCLLVNNIPDGFMMCVDKIDIDRIISNIIQNSADAYRDNKLSGTINVSAMIDKRNGTDYNVIVISDNAGGIPDNIKDYIFKEEITTKKDGHGIGLKHIYDMITKELNGEIEYNTEKRTRNYIFY